MKNQGKWQNLIHLNKLCHLPQFLTFQMLFRIRQRLFLLMKNHAMCFRLETIATRYFFYVMVFILTDFIEFHSVVSQDLHSLLKS